LPAELLVLLVHTLPSTRGPLLQEEPAACALKAATASALVLETPKTCLG
jgi:hypothetical protein